MNHFLEFIGKPRNNHYQIRKLVEFLESLQDIRPILDYFSDGGFRRYVAFPYLKIEKRKGWWVELSICRELHLYQYPFHLPESFLNYQNKYQLKAQINFLLAFSVRKTEKVFDIEKILEPFQISNSNIRKVKLALIKTFVAAKDFKLIENQVLLVLKNKKVKTVTKLTTHLISRTRFLYFKELTQL